MVKPRTAGAIIIDRLRDRIVSGLYLGVWRPGDKLPSIREIARAEAVDRKTAAAAYRRLAREALVEVRPRSGVYLRGVPRSYTGSAMDRIHERWLERTYASARELGLLTDDILGLIGSVDRLEESRVPVLECNWAQASSIADELRRRLDIHAIAYLFDDIRPGDPLPREAPVLVGTPYHRTQLRRIAGSHSEVVEVTAPASLIERVRDCAARAPTTVIMPNIELLQKIRGAFERLVPDAAASPVWLAVTEWDNPPSILDDANVVILWPGTPDWVGDVLPGTGIEVIRPERPLSDESIARVQSALLSAAVRASHSEKPVRKAVYASQ